MAVYVKMIKKFDDEKRVVYQFGPNENWASEQILKIMFRNDGQFPDVTSVEK